jgi:hypothetical protein
VTPDKKLMEVAVDRAKMLRKAISEFVAHYHLERNHQGLENRLIIAPQAEVRIPSAIRRRSRLGEMLNYYYRQAA